MISPKPDVGVVAAPPPPGNPSTQVGGIPPPMGFPGRRGRKDPRRRIEIQIVQCLVIVAMGRVEAKAQQSRASPDPQYTFAAVGTTLISVHVVEGTCQSSWQIVATSKVYVHCRYLNGRFFSGCHIQPTREHSGVRNDQGKTLRAWLNFV